MNVIEAISAEAWAIQAEVLQQIVTIAQRLNDPAALQTRAGQPLRNTRTVTARDGVAIIPVVGPIFHRANMFTDISGATSNEVLAKDISAALDDSKIHSLLLNIDSPGGQVAGTSELADLIFEGRQRKPIHAYIEARGASGGYWLASAADRVTINSTALAGSIGVVMAADTRERGGEIEIVSSNAPNKRIDAGSDDGLQKLQAMVDRLEREFIGAVARNRGVTPDRVVSDFGQGGLFIGSDAVEAGLADAVGSFESALAGLTAENRSSVFMSTAKAAGDTPAITIDLIKSQYPDIAAQLRAEGENAAIKTLTDGAENDIADAEKRGADDERARIQAVYEQGSQLPGHNELVASLMFDGETTGPEAAVKILAAEKVNRANVADKYHGSAPKAAPTVSTDDITATDDDLPVEEKAAAEWDKSAAIRAEFANSKSAYIAFRKAEAGGRIRQLKAG